MISFIGSTNIAVTLSSCVIFGRIAEVYGYRLIAALGLLLYVVSLIGASFSPSAAGLVGLQGVFHGVAQACLFLAATAIPAPYFNARLSVAMGVRLALHLPAMYGLHTDSFPLRWQTVAAASGLGGVSLLPAKLVPDRFTDLLQQVAWSFINRRLIDVVGVWWTLRIVALVGGALMTPAVFFIKTPASAQADIKSGSYRTALKYVKQPSFYLFYISSALTATGYSVSHHDFASSRHRK